MPTVPTLERRVREAPLPTPRVSSPADNGLGQLGQGIAKVGDVTTDLALQARDEAKKTQLAGFYTEVEKEWSTHWNDSQKGLRHKLGAAAFAAGDDLTTKRAIRKFRDERLAKLPEWVREEARLRSDEMLLGYEVSVEDHVGRQRRVAKEAARDGLAKTMLDAIATDHTNDVANDLRSRNVIANIKDLADSPEQADAMASAWVKERDKAVLDQYLLNNDTEGAARYFSQASDLGDGVKSTRDRLGDQATTYEERIRAVTQDKEATDAAQAIVGELVSVDDDRVNEQALGAVETEINNIEDPEVRELVRAKAATLTEAATKLFDRKKADRFNDALGAYLRGGKGRAGLGAIPKERKDWLLKHDPKAWEAIENRAKEEEEDRARAARRGGRGAARGRTPDQFLAMMQLRHELATKRGEYEAMSPGEFARRWYPQLSGADFDEGSKAWTDRLERWKKGEGGGITESAYDLAVDAGAASAGITEKDQRTEFSGRMAMERLAWEANNPGKSPTPEDTQAWADRAAAGVLGADEVAERVGARAGGGVRGRAPESPPAPKPRAQIPANVRAELEAALRGRGRSVTDAEVERLWKKLPGGK